AFEALRVVGAPAEPEVRTALDETTLRPYALLWLAEHDGADPDDAHGVLTRQEATWLWVDTAAAVADHGDTRRPPHQHRGYYGRTAETITPEKRLKDQG
ncbi:hypothetical protein ACWEPR_38310, partial [Streptomyces sp. NPDC004290]